MKNQEKDLIGIYYFGILGFFTGSLIAVVIMFFVLKQIFELTFIC